MPPSAVTNEAAWDKAKRAVKEGYPEVSEGSDRYYRLVMGTYQRMSGEKSLGIPAPVLKAAAAYLGKIPHDQQQAHTQQMARLLRRALVAKAGVGPSSMTGIFHEMQQ